MLDEHFGRQGDDEGGVVGADGDVGVDGDDFFDSRYWRGVLATIEGVRRGGKRAYEVIGFGQSPPF